MKNKLSMKEIEGVRMQKQQNFFWFMKSLYYRKGIRLAVVFLWALFHSVPLQSAETIVTTPEELKAALASARPGTMIVMKNGQWTDVRIDMHLPGTEQLPVVLKAENNGSVILSGTSQLIFSADWQIVNGLCFKGGGGSYNKKYASVVRFNSNNCQLTQSAIIDFNPADPKTSFYYVYFAGNANRMDHCVLMGKGNNAPVVGNDNKDSRYNTVDHCLIKDIPLVPNNNGREIFRIWGYGHHDIRGKGAKGNFFTIEKNIFDHADGEGTEIISLKSDSNIVRNNIIRASSGELSLRGGNFNRVEGNVIIGEKGRGCFGIRVAGHGHTIIQNVVRDCESGIRLMCGEYIEKGLTKEYEPKTVEGAPLGRMPWYGWVYDCIIANNTLVNNDGPDFLMGFRYKNKWPAIQLILIPENNSVINNFIVKSHGLPVVEETVQDTRPPFDVVKFRPNIYEGNICLGGIVLPSVINGFKMIDLKSKDKVVSYSPKDYGLPQNLNEDILLNEEVGPSWLASNKLR
jgi:poly(beta-D-mannuronate) lyase